MRATKLPGPEEDWAALLRYVAIALTAALATALPAAASGEFTGRWDVAGAAVLAAVLALLAVIDWRERMLPDLLTLPLLLAGIARAAVEVGGLPLENLAGAVAGYAAFALIAAAYRRWRGREGLGLGDAKLLAAGGAWCGWPALPMIVLLGALTALLAVAAAQAAGRRDRRDDEIPFGTFLCLAIWLVFLYRDVLLG
jgi:leader peptidase (prepilin peptidase)/N-methyltransferase